MVLLERGEVGACDLCIEKDENLSPASLEGGGRRRHDRTWMNLNMIGSPIRSARMEAPILYSKAEFIETVSLALFLSFTEIPSRVVGHWQ
jgi:hypothetical protein